MELLVGLLNDMFFAAIPAVGFALVFNVPPRALIYCALGGAIGHGSRYLMMKFGIPIEWATFFCSYLSRDDWCVLVTAFVSAPEGVYCRGIDSNGSRRIHF